MNIFKTLAVKDLEAATRAIPVIDFAPAFRGEPGGLEAVASQVRRASEEVGFYSPNVDSVIECLPSCVGPGHPPRYEPAVYRDLVLAFYNANYFHRKNYAGKPAAP
jgi:isopenicillin N synthase-like dioxygenase